MHKPSAVAISDQDIVRCNRMAVGQKQITAKDVYDFQLSHQHVKKQKPKSQQLFVKPSVPFAGPYGIASYPNMKQEMKPGQSLKPPPGSIGKVINGDYFNYQPGPVATYPDMSRRQHPGKMPAPRATNSSKLKDAANRQPQGAAVEPFVMKRFQNVPSRVFSAPQQPPKPEVA